MTESDPSNAENADLLIGSYRLISPLGSGGMSSVFRAVHIESGLEVAVKILPRSMAKNPTMLKRFLREAQSAEALEHPNIVAMYDHGVDDGRYYLVLEFVKGGDLHDRVRNEGPLGIAEAIAVIRSVAEGLQYASKRGLIHRDIKPANLLLSPDGRVKIIDLGLALKAESEDERVTRAGTTVGTVDYMAPEQARDSRATSERSDIYSLGCTLYFLLTGSTPFPGGDIADKLRRHCTIPAPDPGELRPEIPLSLGQLIRKMMAKRPEQRYKDYAELLDALASITVPEPTESVDVIIEDEDAEGIPLAPIESGVTAALLERKGRGGDPRSPHVSSINLAELGEDDGTTPPPRRRPPSSASPPKSSVPEIDREPLDDDGEGEEMVEGEENDELVEVLGSGRMAIVPDPDGRSKSLKLVCAGIGVGVALILLVILVRVSLPGSKPKLPEEIAVETNEVLQHLPDPEVVVPPVSPPMVRQVPLPPPAVAMAPTIPPSVTPEITSPRSTVNPAPNSAWSEPGEPVVVPLAESFIAADIEAKFPLPPWAKSAIPPSLAGTILKVRRISDPGDPQERSSLSSAFDLLRANTTELIDDGPFLESDLRIHGDAQLVRSALGRRPIVRLDRPKLEAAKDQPALIALDGKQLILDGIDLIVHLQDLPRKQTALFSCRGGGLVLNRCTITVHNPLNQPYSLIRAQGGDRPAQVRVEESVLRGSSISLIEMAGGGVEVAVIRSMLMGGQGPLIVSMGSMAGGDRRIHLQRSVLSGRGPIIDLSSPDFGRPATVSVRALGSTFARFRSDALVSLISFHDQVGEIKDSMNWLGEHNTFVGWSDWVSMGSSAHLVKVASLDAARTAWPSTDAMSQESPNPWPDPPDVSRVIPDQMNTIAPQALPTLSRVAMPSPYLWEKTIEEFKRPEPPLFDSPIATLKKDEAGFVSVVEPVYNPMALQEQLPFNPPGTPGTPGVGGEPNPQAPVPIKELLFDVLAAPWKGDLGRFLQEQLKPGDLRVLVRVSGSGAFNFTPVKLPEGTSLEIIVETSRVKQGVPPTWRPYNIGNAEALIDVKRGDLVLNGVELLRDATKTPLFFIRVDQGHLVLNRCTLTYQPRLRIAEPGKGQLISFRARSTRPLPIRPWPFAAAVDKPVCRIIESVLIAPGDLFTAEVGRGMIALSECVIESGGTIFSLTPAKVARNRFEADLSIEHCTLAAEKSFFLLGPWLGSTPGPDRPWLVSSRSSAYMSSYTPPSRESVLLRVEPNSLAQGSLFWQGYNDAYEVINFTARNDKLTMPNPYPDLARQWINFWGSNHIRNSFGPSRGNKLSVAFVARLTPNSITPPMAYVSAGDLALDPSIHPGRASVNLGADLSILLVTPRKK